MVNDIREGFLQIYYNMIAWNRLSDTVVSTRLVKQQPSSSSHIHTHPCTPRARKADKADLSRVEIDFEQRHNNIVAFVDSLEQGVHSGQYVMGPDSLLEQRGMHLSRYSSA